jgi:aspartyl-tRNA(Asn)/glutamyl-tRNA(Gln) amidotransferase subunit C
MSTGFTREQVEAIAALAQLELSESEIELFARQLGDILEYATQVQRIDTTGVPPTATLVIGDEDTDRPDEVCPSLERGEALMNAPEADLASGFFKVPRVIE